MNIDYGRRNPFLPSTVTFDKSNLGRSFSPNNSNSPSPLRTILAAPKTTTFGLPKLSAPP